MIDADTCVRNEGGNRVSQSVLQRTEGQRLEKRPKCLYAPLLVPNLNACVPAGLPACLPASRTDAIKGYTEAGGL
jgi:hypothetical protein